MTVIMILYSLMIITVPGLLAYDVLLTAHSILFNVIPFFHCLLYFPVSSVPQFALLHSEYTVHSLALHSSHVMQWFISLTTSSTEEAGFCRVGSRVGVCVFDIIKATNFRLQERIR